MALNTPPRGVSSAARAEQEVEFGEELPVNCGEDCERCNAAQFASAEPARARRA